MHFGFFAVTMVIFIEQTSFASPPSGVCAKLVRGFEPTSASRQTQNARKVGT